MPLVLMAYLVTTAIVGWQAADEVGWLRACGYVLLALVAFFVGYQVIAALIYARKLALVLVQFAIAAGLLWAANETHVFATVFETTFAPTWWIAIALGIGGISAIGHPPSAEEIDEAKSL